MIEIGTEFKYSWSGEDGEEYDEMVSVQGYTYYHGDLFYVCVGPSGVCIDICDDTMHSCLEGDDE